MLERGKTGTATYIVGMAKDKTREHRAEQSFQLMASAFSSSREPMLVLSTSLQITESNKAFRRLARLGDTETVEKLRLDCFLSDAQEPLERINQSRQERFETELTTRDGEAIAVDVSLAVFEARHQSSSYLIATLRDISERKKNEQQLRVLANHDDLTGLKNRLGLRSALEELVDEQQHFVLSFIDLDGFKQINDIAGHELGDECLQIVARLLSSAFPASAIVTRWGGDEFIIVSPGIFIPLAEQHGLDMDIGLVALESACEYISMLETERISLPLSVNISANQLLSESFAEDAAAICAEHFVSPELVEIEITESIFIQDEAAAIRGLAALKSHGFILALDDFGSGFSSLSYLRKFDFDVIKLDRSLVKGIDGSERARALLNGIYKMLDSLRLEVIIEGVDNSAYLPLLENIGINAYQGFLFEKPLPYDQFILKHTQGWRMVK